MWWNVLMFSRRIKVNFTHIYLYKHTDFNSCSNAFVYPIIHMFICSWIIESWWLLFQSRWRCRRLHGRSGVRQPVPRTAQTWSFIGFILLRLLRKHSSLRSCAQSKFIRRSQSWNESVQLVILLFSHQTEPKPAAAPDVKSPGPVHKQIQTPKPLSAAEKKLQDRSVICTHTHDTHWAISSCHDGFVWFTERARCRTQTMRDGRVRRKSSASVRTRRKRSDLANAERTRTTQRSGSNWSGRCLWGICRPAARRRCFSQSVDRSSPPDPHWPLSLSFAGYPVPVQAVWIHRVGPLPFSGASL